MCQGPFRLAALRCTLRAPRTALFVTLHPHTIARFLGCRFEECEGTYKFCDFMLDKEEDFEETAAVLGRRNTFQPEGRGLAVVRVSPSLPPGAAVRVRTSFLLV